MRISDWSSDVCSSDLLRCIEVADRMAHLVGRLDLHDTGAELGRPRQPLGISGDMLAGDFQPGLHAVMRQHGVKVLEHGGLPIASAHARTPVTNAPLARPPPLAQTTPPPPHPPPPPPPH